MRIEYCVGIDLGSTTTKAVVLGDGSKILGRGITNSRSNYDVACQIALDEALIHTRFSLIRENLPTDDAEVLLQAFERLFRAEQYGSQLDALDETLRGLAADGGEDVRGLLGAVLTGLARMAASAGDPQRYTAAVEVLDRFFDGSLVTARSSL